MGDAAVLDIQEECEAFRMDELLGGIGLPQLLWMPDRYLARRKRGERT
jgi:hypothetical protein